jgi:crotonobetainyl-CoA:carnitine CoA-transferase CaiB-like acyl-CoA transferase
MDEEELDRFLLQPLNPLELTKADVRMRRTAALAEALWGKTRHDLERQLLAARVVLAPAFELADYLALEQSTRRVLVLLKNDRVARLFATMNSTMTVGTATYTEVEARCEIVRRAIQQLEGR